MAGGTHSYHCLLNS